MEELQSTELLGREILEDARRKASRILKAADDTIKAKSDERKTKTSETLAELEKNYSEQSRLTAEEIMNVLPLDKRRAKAKKIEELLNSAVETWYSRLNPEQVNSFLKKELAKRITECNTFIKLDGLSAAIHKIERKEAEAILKAVLPGKSCHIEEIYSASPYPELVLENREVRIHASVGKAVDFFLDDKRKELVEALLGKAIFPEETA
jgi:vacuolar-type H+-ATPase subunit E/Vma4